MEAAVVAEGCFVPAVPALAAALLPLVALVAAVSAAAAEEASTAAAAAARIASARSAGVKAARGAEAVLVGRRLEEEGFEVRTEEERGANVGDRCRLPSSPAEKHQHSYLELLPPLVLLPLVLLSQRLLHLLLLLPSCWGPGPMRKKKKRRETKSCWASCEE